MDGWRESFWPVAGGADVVLPTPVVASRTCCGGSVVGSVKARVTPEEFWSGEEPEDFRLFCGKHDVATHSLVSQCEEELHPLGWQDVSRCNTFTRLQVGACSLATDVPTRSVAPPSPTRCGRRLFRTKIWSKVSSLLSQFDYRDPMENPCPAAESQTQRRSKRTRLFCFCLARMVSLTLVLLMFSCSFLVCQNIHFVWFLVICYRLFFFLSQIFRFLKVVCGQVLS